MYEDLATVGDEKRRESCVYSVTERGVDGTEEKTECSWQEGRANAEC